MTLVTSGEYSFAPSMGEVVLNAFARIGVRRTELQVSHMQDARMETNFLLAKMSNQVVNLWTVELQTCPLLQGVATYSVPAETVMVLDAYVSYGSPTTDQMVFPVSRTEYASYTNKQTQAFPNVFWFDRLISPTITLYPVPDGNGPYVLKYYSTRQIQDADFANGLNIETPYLWMDAITAGLAHRLARIYAPQFEQQRKMDADEAWAIAATNNVENVGLYLTPGITGYFR